MCEREHAVYGEYSLRKVLPPSGTQPYASTGGESHSSGTETIRIRRSNDAEMQNAETGVRWNGESLRAKVETGLKDRLINTRVQR